MRSRSLAFLVVILFLLLTPAVFSIATMNAETRTGILAPSSPYTENLSMYLTSSEVFWRADLSGGNITVSSVTIPQSVTAYSISLTHYNSWKQQFETFTKYGFGLLGSSEPFPDGALLLVNTTSQGDASTLANSLSQRFGLVFQPIASGLGYFEFLSPMSFTTVVNAYFWKLVPTYYGGFASMFTQDQVESSALAYFRLSYSGAYSVSFGGLSALSGTNFELYTQLGLQQSAFNYSSSAQSSTISVNVLGGFVTNASIPYTNNYSNYTSYMATNSNANNGTRTIPNIGATLDFSFPTILAYRQVTPTLTPTRGTGVSVTINVKNLSPAGIAAANNVFVNDSWIYSLKNVFNLTVSQTSGNQTLQGGQTMTVAYAFNVIASNGTYSLPSTPVSYEFTVASHVIRDQALLEPETIVIGGQNTPLIEATASLASGTVQAGQPLSANVTITNKGSGAAFDLTSAGLTKQNLPTGASWSFIANSTAGSLTSTAAEIGYNVSWKDASGITHGTKTNALSAVFSFGVPDTPAVSLAKSVVYSATKKSANVTLTVINTSPNAVSNLTVADSIPIGMEFAKSFNVSSLTSAGGLVSAKLSSIPANSNKTLVYSVNVSNTNSNYAFMPANVSVSWNGIAIVHYSNGYALPLGVTSIKEASPAQAFQGTNATLTLDLINNGNLPIYNAYLNDSYDSFLQVLKSGSNFTSQLASGQSLEATLIANLTGSSGVHNLTAPSTSFIFAGYSNSAISSKSSISIYNLVESNLTYTALKVEEGHNIQINVTITNPSNVTVTDVNYKLSVPAGLNVLYGGNPDFTVPTLGPNSFKSYSFVVITNQPDVYQFSNASLTFNYQGHQIKGIANSLSLNIRDDIKVRYGIPVIIGLIVVLASVLYIRRITKK